MKKITLIMILLLPAFALAAQDRTLRVDYIFSGSDKSAEISLCGMSCYDGWAGRRHNTDSIPVQGNGQISLTDLSTGKVLYRQSFSTLFQEWQTSEEAVRVRKAFENVFLLPMPEQKAVVRVELSDLKGNVFASLSHVADPADILIRHDAPDYPPHRYLLQSGPVEKCIDIAIVGEGYTAAEAESFYRDAGRAMDAILGHEPFTSYKDRFNFLAVALESEDSGVSIPRQGVWKNTALRSHYDTFYSDRYLTTSSIRRMHDLMGGLPFEHIIILVNAETYGGGGIYNSYTISTARHATFEPVIVHEFGHGFGALGDEYYYDDQYVEFYYPDCEPWEQNITTLYDFDSKWKDMLPEGTAIPTPEGEDKDIWEEGKMASVVGVYEGGGYQSKGVYRPYPDCRMKTNTAKGFCPVCRRAIGRIIEFYTE